MADKQGSDLLSAIKNSSDVRKLDIVQLQKLANEVRQRTIQIVSKNGGHLGAGLGVVELTVALHYVFNTPEDKIIWDVGHQSYPHKILTGRNDEMSTLRQQGGISGFTKRAESIYDPFGAGHSSTSVSAALGMAVARDLNKEDYDVVAVIGDGAMSAGMAYEAMNNAGVYNKRLIVVLNDNKMSIAPAVGAMSSYLSRLISSKPYITIRNFAKQLTKKLPHSIENVARKAQRYTKAMVSGGNLFEEMGFYYVGPVDGHNLKYLVDILDNIKNEKRLNCPILIHVITEKGKGFDMSEPCVEKLHSVAKFDIETKRQNKPEVKIPTYTAIFADNLIKLAKNDEKIIAITAAMPSGTGLDKFAKHYPTRMFDVGIAEQHAVTFAAGLACEGLKPFCCIYSTFLQRAFDQVIHDVAIQKLPVRFAIDRADLVGSDGPTHAGSFDVTYLSTVPNIVVMAPSNELQLAQMVLTASEIDDRPSAFRYPRGEATGIEIPDIILPLEIGKGRIVIEGNDIAIISLGTRLNEALKAREELSLSHNIFPTIVDAMFVKPLDVDLFSNIAKNHSAIIIIESGSIGGLAAHLTQFLINKSLLDNGLKIRTMCLPDYFIEQNNIDAMYDEAKLNAKHIVATVLKLNSVKGSVLRVI